MHHEMEILYCTKGELNIKINNNAYKICENQAIVIGSMMSHEVFEAEEENECLLIEIGPILLRENFSALTRTNFRQKIYKFSEQYSKIEELLKNLLWECTHKTAFSDLFITGNLYKLFGCLMEDIADSNDLVPGSGEANSAYKIRKALEMIYCNYSDSITVENAALACGYCVSNFCKLFKDITGASFHQYLNNFRIKNAEYLLTETELSAEQISEMVGFADIKTFYRVFKSATGVTPGKYRSAKE